MADQWTKHLADKGYTGIALPSPEFRLFTLVFERNGARGHQNAFDQLAPGVAASMAQPERNANLPAIAGERTRSVDVQVGLKILSGLIAALGGGTLGIKAGFDRARKLTFAYDGISSETLNAVLLQQALNGVAPPAGGLLRDWLDDHLYVVTSVLRATKISVSAEATEGETVAVDVPVISGAVGANVSVAAKAGDKSTVTFQGGVAVPFAVGLFQVRETKIGGQRRLTLRTVKAGTVGVKTLPASATGHDADADQGELAPTVLDWNPEREAVGGEAAREPA